MSKELNTLRLSLNNLKQKPFRTASLIAVVAILAFILFGGSILATSLENGLLSMQSRLGADIMVVPEGNGSQVEDILIKAEPSSFYFSREAVDEIEQIKGVTQVTSQFFITPLSASCCSAVVPIIAFDPETDFVVQPWISEVYSDTIKDGELIVGNSVAINDDNTLKFFDRLYTVIARLERTGTGLDGSIYVTKGTMKQMVEDSKKLDLAINTDENVEESVSSILIKIDPEYEARQIAREIRQMVTDVDTVVSQSIVSNVGNSLGTFVSYIDLITLIIWILGVIVLSIVFSVTINERKKEFAVLRILGATRKKLVNIVLIESLLISILGAIIGIIIASLIVFPFSNLISTNLELPYLQPHIGNIMEILAMTLFLSILVGPSTSIYGARKISKAETYLTMREGE